MGRKEKRDYLKGRQWYRWQGEKIKTSKLFERREHLQYFPSSQDFYILNKEENVEYNSVASLLFFQDHLRFVDKF